MNNAAKRIFLLIIFFLTSNLFFTQSSNPEAKELYADKNNKIDSLIRVTKINDKTILISFGAEYLNITKINSILRFLKKTKQGVNNENSF